jgi:hypothetical protein
VFGGLGGLNTNDTWTWDGTTWTRESPAHQPPWRFFSPAAFDRQLGGVVLFGGSSPNGDLNDVWAWTGSDWHPVRTAKPPAPRESSMLAVDEADGALLLFGGQARGLVRAGTWKL